MAANVSSRSTAIIWVIGVLALVALGTWFLTTPDPKATEREAACRTWGIVDAATLAACRESPDKQAAAVAPLKLAALDREIDAFNQDLTALARRGTTRVDETAYVPISIREAAELSRGGMLSFVSQAEADNLPANGRRVNLTGVIDMHTPEPGDGGERYFTLDGEARAKGELPDSVNLDIESLNRHERQFILDDCGDLFSTTPCRATVLGHVGEIVGRRSFAFTHTGIVADAVKIEPLNRSTARPDGMPSPRALLRQLSR